jgi:hypothetical protein
MTKFERLLRLINHTSNFTLLTFHPLLPLLRFMGVFGKRLFEPSDFIDKFPCVTHEAHQRWKLATGGSFTLVPFFLLRRKRNELTSRVKAIT